VSKATTIERLRERALSPVDGSWLVAFRVLFGITMCVSLMRFIAYGWIDDFFVRPSFHFKYWGFGWVEVLPRSEMHALFWILAGLAAMVALGLWFRVAAFAFALGFSYLQLCDATTYLNHYYLASLLAFLLALSPAKSTHPIPAAWLWLFRFQVGVVYTFAGLGKASSDWLVHSQPLGIWLGSRTDMPILGPLFAHEWAAPLMSWAGFLFDTTIAWWLLARRTRPYAFAAVVVFHVVTRLLFPIGMFPFIMVTCALVFFAPDWPRKLLGRVSSRVQALPAVAAPVVVSRWARPLLALGVAYAALQVALPLRYLAYGGNVLWHEQGMRWSWRVMVREKNGSVTYVVRQTESGRVWHVAPRSYLNRIQEREMSAQPDLILQLAHHVRDDFERRGLGPVEVRVDATASLNGRRRARLVDPDVDLARVRDSLAPAAWIAPAPSVPPPRIRPLSPDRVSGR
jgi:hypothetical protein